MQSDKKGKNIQSVQRAVDIINCFNESNLELSLSEISDLTSLNRSTAHGILATLAANGYIHQTSSGKYMLGQTLLTKSRFAQSTARLALIDAAKVYMTQIADSFKMTVSLFMVESWQPVHLLKIIPENGVYSIQRVSDADPLYCTATGKLILSHMPDAMLNSYLDKTDLTALTDKTITGRDKLLLELRGITSAGYSHEREELGEGVCAISAPIFESSGKVYGSISITGVANTLYKCHDDAALALKDAADKISGELASH